MQPQFVTAEIEPEVIAAAQRGGTDAFEAIYRHYSDRLYTMIRRLAVRQALADDILQEVFIEVLRNIRSYSAAGSFGGWLRAIAVNKTLSHLRSPWLKRTLWLDSILPTEAQSLLDHASDGCNTQSTDFQLGDQAALASALEQLSPNARTVVWLHDVEGYTHQEIGHLLGGTASMSKSQLARAHTRLRQLLAAYENMPCTPVSNNY
jgi:RNA polymerase sigma-70 factor (ECF subfamily)